MTTSEVTFTPVARVNCVRTTNLPASDNFACCAWVQIVSYQDYGELMSLEQGIGFFRYLYLEYEAAGMLSIAARWGAGGGQAGGAALWSDARTTWNFVAMATDPIGSGGLIRSYHMSTGGVWTVGPTLAADATWSPGSIAMAAATTFPTDENGSHRYRSPRFWNTTKTEAQLRAEAFSVKPRSLAGLTFWNPGLVPGQLNVDMSGTGGDMTLTGVPTASDSDPRVAWQALTR